MTDHVTQAAELVERLRSTWPKSPDFGPITTAQRDTIHEAADLIERLSAELAARSGGDATGPWLRVGSFVPDPAQQYIVQGGFRTSIKWGSEIDADNLFAAVLSDPRNQQHGKIRL